MDPNFSFDAPDAASTDAAEEILGQMPEVQQHAIDQHIEQQNQDAANVECDAAGVPFDSKLHTGTRLKDGTWRKRKGGGSASGPSIVAPSRKATAAVGAGAAGNTVAEVNAEALATGQVIATLFLGMCQSIGGDEWQPTDQERDFQTSAWQAYCVAHDVKELSPGLAVCIAVSSYALPRFTKPKTAAKMSRIKTWIALRIARRKVQKELRKRGIEATVTIKDGELHMNGKPMDASINA